MTTVTNRASSDMLVPMNELPKQKTQQVETSLSSLRTNKVKEWFEGVKESSKDKFGQLKQGMVWCKDKSVTLLSVADKKLQVAEKFKHVKIGSVELLKSASEATISGTRQVKRGAYHFGQKALNLTSSCAKKALDGLNVVYKNSSTYGKKALCATRDGAICVGTPIVKSGVNFSVYFGEGLEGLLENFEGYSWVANKTEKHCSERVRHAVMGAPICAAVTWHVSNLVSDLATACLTRYQSWGV